MQGARWPDEDASLVREDGRRALPEDLLRAAHGEATLTEAFQTLVRYREEQARAAADLLERETWALTAILATSGPIWNHLKCPTLRFPLDSPGKPVSYHLELGHFPHLAALLAPSVDEQALIAATTPCWARVYPHAERQRAGETGALACSYVPIPVAEAVAALGLGRILTQIEAATCAVGQSLAAQARAQGERYERLQRVERLLGWEAEPTAEQVDRARAVGTGLVLALLGQGAGARIVLVGAFLGPFVILLGLVIGFPLTLLALVLVAIALLVWNRSGLM